MTKKVPKLPPTPPHSRATLTAKQERFIEEYLIDLNATAAARRAGYKGTAPETMGLANLRNPRIKAAIEARRSVLRKKVEITQEYLIEGFRRVAEADIRDVFNWKNGKVTLRDSSDIPDAIQSIEQTFSKDGDPQFKVRLYDRLEALNSLAKHLGFFAKDNKLEINQGEVWVQLAGAIKSGQRITSASEESE
jgi:phage terminase small subunit